MPDAYATLKSVFVTRYSLTQIDIYFKLLDLLPLSNLHPLTLHSDIIIALLPTDANIFVNNIYLPSRGPEDVPGGQG
jgi:hypothetical protein